MHAGSSDTNILIEKVYWRHRRRRRTGMTTDVFFDSRHFLKSVLRSGAWLAAYESIASVIAVLCLEWARGDFLPVLRHAQPGLVAASTVTHAPVLGCVFSFFLIAYEAMQQWAGRGTRTNYTDVLGFTIGIAAYAICNRIMSMGYVRVQRKLAPLPFSTLV